MEEFIVPMKCKDFDAYFQFICRLFKIGSNYMQKNDCMVAIKRNAGITGRHIIKDPLFVTAFHIPDAIYLYDDLGHIVKTLSDINENKRELRKNIKYYRTKEEFGFIFGDTYTVQLAKLLVGDVSTNILSVASGITIFNDLIYPMENMVENAWKDLSLSQLIALRDGQILDILDNIGDKMVSTRIAKSLFILAGVSRYGNPIANASRYVFLPSDQSDLSTFRLQSIYKCGQSENIKIDCVHEYIILVYGDLDDSTE